MANGPWDMLTVAQRRGLDDALEALSKSDADVVSREYRDEYAPDGLRAPESIAAVFDDGIVVVVTADGEWRVEGAAA